MENSHPTIFRTEALQHRLSDRGRRKTEATFPRVMMHRVIFALWLLQGLLVLGGAAACFMQVPVSSSGLAIVLGPDLHSDDVSVMALIPPEDASRLHVDDSVRLFPGTASQPVAGTVIEVAPDPLPATGIEQRLGLLPSSLAMLDDEMVIVSIAVAPGDAAPLAPGMTGRVETPAGTRRAGAFLPVIGHVFRSER